jgi:nucleotide-binding universal stress UspA family protein
MEHTKIKKILCPVDFSPFSIRAYHYASSIAQHNGAKLFVQHVIEIWKYPAVSFMQGPDQYDEFCAELIASGRDEVSKFLNKHQRGGIHPDCIVQQGVASDCILSLAQEKAIDLIVIGTHGLHGFDRLLLGSVTEEVLRRALCPVLAVHHSTRSFAESLTEERPTELREILCGVDFSQFSDRACEYAFSLAAEYGAHLTLIHVLEGAHKLHVKEKTEKADQALRKLIPGESTKQDRITTTVRVGSPYKEITQLASENKADLIVMGMQGHDSLDDAVFGSTTYRVVQLGHCPVLAVHA